MKIINPATEEPVTELAEDTPTTVADKYARARRTWEKKARASAGRLRKSCDSPDISKGKLAQGAVPGDILFGGICAGLL